ncbi:MAG: nucleotide exchange factor GrpE [Pseudomonadales bacterium]|jgi:molecular chaperone GrpE|nr:nucleotide exchange factor GrpE [Pseudomonadales bacterium]|tara:strand:- start:3825 stop:4400 length:576 start_codon:yes stop_codon:yes gene_type:complete
MSEQEQPSETEVELELDAEVVEDSAEAPTEDVLQEVTLESVQAELEVALVKVDEQQADVLRAQAEAQNIRRRSEQDVAKAHKFGQEKLMTEVVSLLDNLGRAIEAGSADGASLKGLLEGVEMSQKMLLDGLQKFNVTQLDPHGEPFNPELHEAMTAVPNPDLEPNTVMEVFQKGYTLNGRLVRPAMVVVSK